MSKGKHHLSVLSRNFFTYKQSPDESVEQVYTTLRRYQTEIASIDPLARLPDIHLVNSLLHALDNEVYDCAVFKLKYEISDPSIEKTLALLKEVEMEERSKNNPKSASALKTQQGSWGERQTEKKSNPNMKCHRCHCMGHYASSCYASKSKSGEKLPPSTAAKKPQEKGQGNARQATEKDKDNQGSLSLLYNNNEQFNGLSHVLKAMAREALVRIEPFLSKDCWIVDSGVSHHMTPDKSLFVDMKSYSTDICLANGASIKASGIGEARAKFGGKLTILKNVLYVPGLDSNLLSIGAAQNHHVTVEFSLKKVEFKHHGVTIATAMKIGSVYVVRSSDGKTAFKAQSHKKSATCLVASVTVQGGSPDSGLAPELVSAGKEPLGEKSGAPEGEMLLGHKTPEKPAIPQSQTEFQKWHRQLGHAGSTCMRRLKDCVTGINRKLSPTDLEKDCSACLHSKMVQVQGKDSTPRATRRNERAFSDIWGPYKVSTLGGSRYFASFTDEFSRYSTLYLLHRRTDIYNAFEEYRTIAERDTHEPLRFLRTDNAKEYEKLARENQDKGIEFEFTTTYTPEQNGVSERLNRTIMECIRSLLFDSSLPPEFWGEAAQTACYLRNRLPLGDSHGAKTLYELWTGFKPFIEHLRVFGCVVHTYIPSVKRAKLESTSRRGIFVGYCSTSKQFRVYFPILKTAERVSHLIFLENEKGGQLLENPHQYKKGWESPIDLESMGQLIADADEPVRAEPSDNAQRPHGSSGNTEPVGDSTEDPEFQIQGNNPGGNFEDIDPIEPLSPGNQGGGSSDSDEVSGTIIVAPRPQFQNPMAAEPIRS